MTSDSAPSDKQPAKDRIYASPLEDIVDFAFDEQVVSVFADMINRSVPGYSTIVKSLGILASRHAQPDSRYAAPLPGCSKCRPPMPVLSPWIIQPP